MDVTDYRGGESQRYFMCNTHSIGARIGYQAKDFNGFNAAEKALSTLSFGEDAIFMAGHHCAIVRKVSGGYEYLELQGEPVLDNLWEKLTKAKLKTRFSVQKSHSRYGTQLYLDAVVVKMDRLKYYKKKFRELLGYINTDANKQCKGGGGGMK